MRILIQPCLALAAVLCFGGAEAWAQQVYVYPSQGQSQAQQNADQGQCYAWAVQQSGYDPANPQMAGAPPAGYSEPQGDVLRGAARGAAGGAIGGAIAGNAGKGAAIGAAVGGLFGGMRRRDRRRQQESQQQQYYQAQQYGLSAYNRAFGACMQGRGYTIN